MTDPTEAEQFCSTMLGPWMREAISNAIVDGWFFIRKSPWWRLRYRPARPIRAAAARQYVGDFLTSPGVAKHIDKTIHQVYEPETTAFGGRAAMGIAHQLFSADSEHIANYLAITARTGLPDPRRELSLLLTTALASEAGQEWYEQGDIWAHVAALRGNDTALASHPDTAALTVRRFLTADPAAATGRLDSSLTDLASDWLDGFRAAGTALRSLADQGRLERGLRAVIGHHVLFHWNRIGLTFSEQQRLARAARDAAFADPSLINIGQASQPEARSMMS
ncbi:thiopeptide-type bacteriocin biosynthesis protein [Glycomyces sp. L485]|nr:thiopeptide-type bacteriocin biosynthesis protein [Glycomyces sp. L485]